MDDLLALMEEEEPPTEDPPNSHTRLETQLGRTNERVDRKEDIPDSPENACSGPQVAASIDAKVGIRMINRKIAGLDLLDLISECPYHSTAAISAMSLANLNRMLAEPTTTIAASTVCGRTNMVTVGVVFHNSGTRISSSGNAFCSLTLGNLTTGPAVSVLLFGRMYSTFCKMCQPGKVVALLQPRLLPMKQGSGSTSVSFTVNDERQFMVVADARDYGTCKATTRGHRLDGDHTDSDVKRCRNFVDTRTSQYCKQHRHLANIKKAGAKTTAMQQIRNEAQCYPTAAGKMLMPPATQQVRKSTQMMNEYFSRRGPAATSEGQRLASNRLLNPATKQIRNNVIQRPGPPAQPPSRQPLSVVGATRSTLIPPTPSLRTTNPYASKTIMRQPARPESTTRTPAAKKAPPTARPVTHDWLQDGAKRRAPSQSLAASANAPKRRRAVNTDTAGFNGRVIIPKPTLVAAPRLPTTVARGPIQPQDRTAEEIRSKQRLLLEQQRERKARAEASGESVLRRGRKQTLPKTREADLFSVLEGLDVKELASQKSRFANEVDAEEYVRSRQVVTELEEKEARKDKKAMTKRATEQGPIQKEWHCQTCNRTFPNRPTGCVRANHNIQIKRTLQAKKTTEEKRLAMSEKSSDNGGLVLGRGLEWNRWSRFS